MQPRGRRCFVFLLSFRSGGLDGNGEGSVKGERSEPRQRTWPLTESSRFRFAVRRSERRICLRIVRAGVFMRIVGSGSFIGRSHGVISAGVVFVLAECCEKDVVLRLRTEKSPECSQIGLAPASLSSDAR